MRINKHKSLKEITNNPIVVESAVVIENQRFTTTTWKTKEQFTTLSTEQHQWEFSKY